MDPSREGLRVLETLLSALADAGVSPTYRMELGSREAVREAVAAGLGVGVGGFCGGW